MFHLFIYLFGHCFFYSLVQHVKQLVKHILAGEVRLCWLVLGHGGEERAVPPGQTGCRVPQSAEWQRQLKSSLTFKITCTRHHCAFFCKRHVLIAVLKVALSANTEHEDLWAGWRSDHPASKRKEEESCWHSFMKRTSIVKKSACIMLNICTTHNGDYAPFRQRHLDLLPWNFTPASALSLPLFLLSGACCSLRQAEFPPQSIW